MAFIKDGNRDWSFQSRHCLIIIFSKSSMCLLGEVDFDDATDGVILRAEYSKFTLSGPLTRPPGPLSLKTEPCAENRSVSLTPLAVVSCVKKVYR